MMNVHPIYYNFIVYIYALSLLFIAADLHGKNRAAKQFGTGLLAFVWLLQTVLIVWRTASSGYLAIYSMFETLLFLSWMLCTASLILQWKVRPYSYPFFIALAGMLLLIASLFFDSSSRDVLYNWRKERHFITIHVLFALSGYVVLLFSAVFSGAYLFLYRKLKERKWSSSMRRLPSLDQIERYAFGSVAAGLILLLCSLLFGLTGIISAREFEVLADIKVLSTFVMLAIYGVYMLLHVRNKASPKQMAWYNIAAFAVLLVNLFAANDISQFH